MRRQVPKASNPAVSKTMKSNRSKDSKLELIIRRALWKEGYRYKKNNHSLFGVPDISFPNLKIVIFLDSCFWHACPIHFVMPKSNTAYWVPKINRNTERDNEVSTHYLEEDWTILRFWEHEVYNDLERILKTIKYFVDEKKKLK